MENNRYTPATINNLTFSIPLYQRLFEWGDEQILQLLRDLYQSFKQNPQSPYYIGMFTVYAETADSHFSLVDGQQRFTVLSLMALAFENGKWNSFLKVGSDKLRLSFFARFNDQEYMNNKIKKEEKLTYVNKKMEKGIQIIRDFVNGIKDEDEKKRYIEYVFEYATFFLSELPKEYNIQDLNRYFESMNATGRGLENHEILKVELLKKLTSNKEFYTRIWNAVSDMDKCLIRQKSDEDISSFRNRVSNAIANLDDVNLLSGLCNDIEAKEGKTEDELAGCFVSLRDVKPKNQAPSKQIQTRNEKAILNFSEFLLQVLWLHLPVELRNYSTEFFNTQKLQQTFKAYLNDRSVEDFFKNLLKYRILFDYFILRISNNEQDSNSYFLYFSDSDTEGVESKRMLEQYQAMLYVSTSSYLWLTPVLEYLKNNATSLKTLAFIDELKTVDNERASHRSGLSLKYGELDRYWFWRLDYYLWEGRSLFFDKKDGNSISLLEIANNYQFKQNRSIEHIEPQTTHEDNKRLLNNDYVDLFGNLAMISSGQNSSLQNTAYEIKRAHVLSFVNERKTNTIESLKLLKLFKYETWNDANFIEHHNEMIQVLIGSFPAEYEQIRSNLEQQLFSIESNSLITQ